MKIWQEHFQQLATPTLEENFDTEKLELVEIQNKIIESIEREKGQGIDHVNVKEVNKAVKNLKAGKAPDEDGISAEHYKYGMDELTPFIVHLLNLILTYLDVTIFLKTGILTPILKKEKDKTLPSSYRGITVTKTFAKILQSILKDRVDSVFNNIQNSLQRGFTEGVSSLCAAFLTSEAIEESKKLKILMILITLDAEKAFDKLNHEILFNKLYHYGIKGKLWILLRNLYKGMSIKVKWEGQCTEDVMVLQGIQQGAKLSTTLYKCYNNVILDSILKSGLGARIGDIQVPAPTCADDIAVLANSTADAQGILDIENEDLEHFILRCKELEQIRSKYCSKIEQTMNEIDTSTYKKIIQQGNLLQLIMDCTSKDINCYSTVYENIETLARNMCYEMHMLRTKRIKT
ncbi:unnamed protein product [Mytilus coruscus]|uniref:Reverse transcriptase domain-containing protein n=1 Tax=Mytilus coruscus TaxID=42192 RepID=A0A6J8DCJ9_MYTCO|nr:unnamed protein product [Mytilus coruscus]